MFIAATEAGRPVSARYLQHPKPWFCPECHAEVNHKAGRKVVPHFAHVAGTACTYGEGESERHFHMKEMVQTFFPNTELEVPILDYRRADCVVTTAKGNRIVVECQASSISLDELHWRWADYTAAGYPVLWLWDEARLNFRRGQGKWEAAVPVEIRETYAECGETVYIADEQSIWEATFVDVERDDEWGHRDLETIKEVVQSDIVPSPGSFWEWRYRRIQTTSGHLSVHIDAQALDVPVHLLPLLDADPAVTNASRRAAEYRSATLFDEES